MTATAAATRLDGAAPPDWPDPDRVAGVVDDLRARPPLVPYHEVAALADRLARVAAGAGRHGRPAPPPGS